jgi:hypothetical protein
MLLRFTIICIKIKFKPNKQAIIAKIPIVGPVITSIKYRLITHSNLPVTNKIEHNEQTQIIESDQQIKNDNKMALVKQRETCDKRIYYG